MSRLDIVDKILIDGIMTSLRADLIAERARGDRLADRAVMLESLVARQEAQLAEITRLLREAQRETWHEWINRKVSEALVVAEGES